MGSWTGTVPSFSVTEDLLAADLQTMADILAALTGQYTAYVPTPTSAGWLTGNGSVTGAYRQTGKAVDGWIAIVGGSTTNWGSAAWSIPLPVASNLGTGAPMGICTAAVSSGAARLGGWAWQNGGSSIALVKEDGTRWAAAVPVSFVSGSELRVWFEYEAA